MYLIKLRSERFYQPFSKDKIRVNMVAFGMLLEAALPSKLHCEKPISHPLTIRIHKLLNLYTLSAILLWT